MTDLMKLLYEYAQSNRVAGFLDCQAYGEGEELEKRTLEALKRSLASGGLEALERYQDVCQEQEARNLEAMFQAGFSLARELG